MIPTSLKNFLSILLVEFGLLKHKKITLMCLHFSTQYYKVKSVIIYF